MTTTSTTFSTDELLAERQWLGSLAQRLVSQDDAADLEQEAWLRTLRLRRAVQAPRAWFGSVARGLAAERARKASRRNRRETEVALQATTDAPATDAVVERFETQRLVTQAISELEEPFRSTLLLRYFDGLSPKEIAEREGVPAGTVRWRLHRAHADLRQRLENEFGGDRWRAMLLPLCASPFRSTTIVAGLAAVALVIGLVVVPPMLANDGPKPTAQQTASIAAGAGTSIDGGVGDVARRTAEPQSMPAPEPGQADDGEERVAGQSATVHFLIRDQDEKPIQGARVRLLGLRQGGSTIDVDQSPLPIPTPSSRTDDLGRASVAVRAPGLLLEQLPETWRVEPGRPWHLIFEASADGFLSGQQDALVADGGTASPEPLVLRRAGRVHGRVTDTQGQPLEAQISIEYPPFNWAFVEMMESGSIPYREFSTETPDARFSIDPCRTGLALVWAKSPEHRSNYRLVTIGAETDAGTIQLQRGIAAPSQSERKIRLRVLSPLGEPVEDARVEFRAANGTGMRQTNDEGEVEIKWWSDARSFRYLAIRASDADGQFGAVEVERFDTEHDKRELRLLTERTTATIEVKSRRSPVAGARVSWSAVTPHIGSEAGTSDTNGRVELPAAGSHPVMLTVEAEGYAKWSEHVTLDALVTVDLSPRRSITGRLVGDDDVPLTDAEVILMKPFEGMLLVNGYRAEWEALTDARAGAGGAFSMESERITPSTRILATAAGYAPTWSEPLRPGQGAIEIRLQRGGRIEGRVRNADGTPRPHVWVAVNSFDGLARTVRADADGRYRFENVRAGKAEVRLADQAIDDDSHQQTSSPWTGAPIPAQWNVMVRGDATTKHDLQAGSCSMSVKLELAGSRAGWTATLTPRWHNFGRQIPMRADGTLRTTVDQDGPYRLEIASPGGPLGRFIAARDVQLVAGDETRITLALDLGSASGTERLARRSGYWISQQKGAWTLKGQPIRSASGWSAPLVPRGEVILTQRTGRDEFELRRFFVD